MSRDVNEVWGKLRVAVGNVLTEAGNQVAKAEQKPNALLKRFRLAYIHPKCSILPEYETVKKAMAS